MRRAVLLLSLLVGQPDSARCQWLQPLLKTETPHLAARVDTTSDQTSAMITGGILGTLGGLLGGATVGSLYERAAYPRCHEFCGFARAVYGGLIGEPLGVALGVHAAGGSRGNFGAEAAASAAILVAGLVLAPHVDSHDCYNCGVYLVLFGVPMAQIAASIAIEHATAKRDQ